MLALGLALLATARPAVAETPQEEQARVLYRKALKHYNVAEYDAAIELFRRAYLLTEAPELLFNMGQAYRLKGAGNCAQALRYYQRFLRAAPGTPRRGSVEAAMADMERCAREERAATQAATQATTRPSPPAQPTESPRREAPPGPRAPRRWPAILLGVSGLALVAGGASVLGWARGRYGELEETCAPSCDAESVTPLRTGQTVGWVLVGAGGAAIAAGLITWLVSRRAPDRSTSSAWIAPLPRGGVEAGLRF